MYNRCCLNSMLALAALNVNLKSPGTIQKEVARMYRNNAIKEINKYMMLPPVLFDSPELSPLQNQEPSTKIKIPYERKCLYVLCYLIIVIFDDIGFRNLQHTEEKIRWGYKLIQELNKERRERKRQANTKASTNVDAYSQVGGNRRESDPFGFCSEEELPANTQNMVPHSFHMHCYYIALTTDLNVSSRDIQPFLWSPEVSELEIEDELLPTDDTHEWWVMRVLALLIRLQHFFYQHGPPTYEEYINNTRQKEWQCIYSDLCAYGDALPQSLSPYTLIDNESSNDRSMSNMYIQSTNNSYTLLKINRIYVLDGYSAIVNLIYNSCIIWALHSKPDMTESERNTVPPGALDRAYLVLGILACCENPTLWIITGWCYRFASMCLEDTEARDNALELHRQYEWITGYTSDLHYKAIQKRWNDIDGYKLRKKDRA